MTCYIGKEDGTSKPIANLRWIRENARYVDRVDVYYVNKVTYRTISIFRLKNQPNGWIRFIASWADEDVCLQWLDRPVFRGVPLRWFGAESICGGFKHISEYNRIQGRYKW